MIRKNIILFFITMGLVVHSLNLYAKPIAYVSILPQKFLLHSIAKDLVDIKVLVKPGHSPETFDPTPQQMVLLSKAKMYFTLGLSFEQVILNRITANNKELNVINTVAGIDKSSMQFDPHTWLDPVLFEQQANSIYLALQKVFPDHLKELSENFQLLQHQFTQLRNSLDKLFLSKSNQLNKQRFVIFHPALSHFAQRYQLQQLAIEHEGKHSSAKHMANLMSSLKQQNTKYILVEKQFSKKEAKTVSKVLKAQLLEIDPLSESWMDNMYDIADKVHRALF